MNEYDNKVKERGDAKSGWAGYKGEDCKTPTEGFGCEERGI